MPKNLFSHPAQPNSVNKHLRHMTTTLLLFFFSGSKLYYQNVHLGRSFDRKGGINIVTKKLFQVASHKVRFAILAGPDGFSGPALTIAYGPHMGIFSI